MRENWKFSLVHDVSPTDASDDRLILFSTVVTIQFARLIYLGEYHCWE
jgi:hypothetical protein